MFRSKKFTIAFISMGVVIVALSAILLTLLFGGKGPDPITPTIPTKENPDHPGADDQWTIRAITEGDAKTCPVVGEDIPANGRFTIFEAGPDGRGILFRKKPILNDMTNDDILQFGGNYSITAKVFVNQQGTPTLLYKTDSGYYVDVDSDYMTLRKDSSTVPVDLSKLAIYESEDQNLLLQITAEDGNHVGFTLFSYTGHEETPILVNEIGIYKENGTARFEYVFGTSVKTGELSFEKENYGEYRVTLSFAETVKIGNKKYTSVVFQTK